MPQSHRFRSLLIILTAFGLAVAAVVFLADRASAQAPPQPPAGKPQPLEERDQAPAQTADEAIAADAQWYARSEGVTQAEAERRLRMQAQMGDVIARLRNAHRTRLAGVVIDHKPTYRLRVRLTGTVPIQAEEHALGGSKLPVVFETGAKVTLEELRASIEKNQSSLRRVYPNLAGMGTDEKTSEIVVSVVATDEAGAAAARAKLGDAVALLGQPVRIEVVPAYPTRQDVRGGSLVSSANFLCTSAFVVKNTAGTTGVTTAGHCDNALTYYNPNGTSIPLTLVAGSEYDDNDQDVQVHTSAYVERPEFYWDDNKTVVRVLSGRRLKSSTAAGDNVCHRGEGSGYSCGYVQQTNFAPTNSTNTLCNGGPCSTVWVRVTGTSLECRGGDSGGPWFASTVAFGIHSGGTVDPTTGACVNAFYMTTDTISSGWSLLYGP
ncbi:MAG TPA: S1 family peptidase [Thermoanaerobaculia bacterium]|jgi:hypothetical protein